MRTEMVLPPKRTTEDFRKQFEELTGRARSAVFQGDVELPDQPVYKLPKLPTKLTDRGDQDLMNFFVRYTRWADYFSAQLTMEEINESNGEALVRRLENLWMLNNRPEGKPASGEITLLKIQMETDEEIIAAREALRITYARRKLYKMLFDQAERDAALCSRELTRRVEGSDIRRRTDRGSP